MRTFFSTFLTAVVVAVCFAATPAFAISVSPVRIELAGDPGQMVSGTVTLLNDSSETQTYYGMVRNFEARGADGVPSFTEDRTGLPSWTAFPGSVTLEPGKSKKVSFTVAIPATAPESGYFAGLLWSTTPPTTAGTSISVGVQVGALMFLRVGDPVLAGDLLSFKTDRFGTDLPLPIQYSVSNTGNDRVLPTGDITYRSWLFVFPKQTFDPNVGEGNTLPGTTRIYTAFEPTNDSPSGYFRTALHQFKSFAIGPYRARLTMTLADATPISRTQTVWIFPWQALSLVIAVLALLFGLWKVQLIMVKRQLARQMHSHK